MTDQHPIFLPHELIKDWATNINSLNLKEQLIMVAQWGADQELEACCSEIGFIATKATADSLRSLRRPKPPSLRKQACDALNTYVYGEPNQDDKVRTYNTIRAALEALPND
jgi:hypothetical protein